MESKTSTYEEKRVSFQYQPSAGTTVNTSVTVRHFDDTYAVTMDEVTSYYGPLGHRAPDTSRHELNLSEYSAEQLKRILASFGL